MHAPISSFTYVDERHKICRCVELYNCNTTLPKGWVGVNQIIRVTRTNYSKEVPKKEVSHYITSLKCKHASQVADFIQEHWAIENKLHWVKDVLMKEDDMSIKHDLTATAVSFLYNTAFNLLRLNSLKPNKDTFARISNKVKELYKLFGVDGQT